MNVAEETLAAQLSQAGIPFEREFRFAPSRRWRADFGVNYPPPIFYGGEWRPELLVEIEGGAFTGGHKRGRAYETDTEKASAAAILGYRVIRATPRQVEDGTCLSWIRQALNIEENAA